MVMQEQGTKMYVDGVLKTHERVVQVEWMQHVVGCKNKLSTFMIACNYDRCPVAYNWFIGDVNLDQ